MDAGGNVLVAAGSNIGDALREIAAEHGFEFEEAGTSVIDHHNYDQTLDSGDHTTLVVGKDQLISAKLIVGNSAKLHPVLFKGIGLVAGKTNNLALSIVRASGTAYSYDPKAVRATVIFLFIKYSSNIYFSESIYRRISYIAGRWTSISKQCQNCFHWKFRTFLQYLLLRKNQLRQSFRTRSSIWKRRFCYSHH